MGSFDVIEISELSQSAELFGSNWNYTSNYRNVLQNCSSTIFISAPDVIGSGCTKNAQRQ
jgi:hypothetical protein